MHLKAKLRLPRAILILALSLASSALLLALPATSQAAEATTSLNPPAQAFPSLTVGQRSPRQQFLFQNEGPEAITIEAISITGANAADFSLEGNSCPGLLAAGETCSLEISFAPSAGGPREAQLEVVNDGEDSPTTAALSGQGLRQELTLSPSPLTFPTTTAGNNTEKQVTVANDSEAPVTIFNDNIEGPGASAFNTSGSNCGNSLNTGQSCTISIRFSPGSEGEQRAFLHVRSEGMPGEQVVELVGIAAPPQLSFEPASFAFGLQPIKEGSAQTTMQLRNIGPAPVQVSLEISGNGSNAFFIGQSNCFGDTLEPNETCSIQVNFDPNQTGFYVAQVRASDNGASFTAEVSGSGGQAILSGSPNPASFGEANVGSTGPTRTITMTNSGDLPGGFFIAILSGGDVGSFQLLDENCTGTPLGPGGSCTAQVRFQPTGPGLKSAQLSFIGDGGEGVVQVNLNGLGVAPDLAPSPRGHDFGSQAENTTGPTQLFTLANSTSGPIVMDDATITGADADQFRLASDTCLDATLAAGEACQVGVRFGPDSAGAKTAALRLSGAAGTFTASLTGTGLASAPTPKPEVSLRWGARPLHSKGTALTVGKVHCQAEQSCQVTTGASIESTAPPAKGPHPAKAALPQVRLTVAANASQTLTLRLTGAARRLLAASPAGTRLRLQLHWNADGRTGQSSSSAPIAR
jgi:hypothetical protein